MPCRPSSSARVDLVAAYNATFSDALQFDPPVAGVTGPSWSFTGQNFRMDVRPNHELTTLVSFKSADGQIVVDDVDERILHFNVPQTVIQAALIPGSYLYDLIMFDGSNPPIRVALAHGKFVVVHGVTAGA